MSQWARLCQEIKQLSQDSIHKIMFKSGFVNIIGNPNVGKSTLTNALMNDRLSIINSKPQTTRHRILGIITEKDYQIILSDSPGMIDNPAYKLQKKMNDFAFSSFEDADILLFVTDIYDKYSGDEHVIQNLKNLQSKKFLVVNKKDQDKDNKTEEVIDKWKEWVAFDQIFSISAMEKDGVDEIMKAIQESLPEGPQYYPEEQMTDKPERFFVSEMIRNNLLKFYKQEIPYSAEVVVDQFKHQESKNGPIINIRANIFVERPTQKSIIIGKGGVAIKQLGIASREDIESFFSERVHLELFVSVKENWRDSDNLLKNFGYGEGS
jgi:GTPase